MGYERRGSSTAASGALDRVSRGIKCRALTSPRLILAPTSASIRCLTNPVALPLLPSCESAFRFRVRLRFRPPVDPNDGKWEPLMFFTALLTATWFSYALYGDKIFPPTANAAFASGTFQSTTPLGDRLSALPRVEGNCPRSVELDLSGSDVRVHTGTTKRRSFGRPPFQS